MAFFKKHKSKGGFDLFGAYSFYIPGGKGIFWIVIMFMIGALLGNVATIAMSTGISPEFATNYGMLISYPLMFVPVMLFCSGASRRNLMFEDGIALDSSNFGRYSGWCISLIVAIATLAAAFVADVFNLILPAMPPALERLLQQMMDGPLWVSLLSVSVFAPFFEEWLCRGMVLRGLLQNMKPGWAIVLSALFFAVIHMNPWQALPAFALGCLFGYVYYRTGSLKLTMLMHCVNNTFATLVSRIPGLGDVDSFHELLSPWAYWLEMVACVLIVAAAVAALSGIKIKEGEKSNCDRICFGDEELQEKIGFPSKDK